MPAQTAPSLSPSLAWDKLPSPAKTPRKKGNPLMVAAIVVMLILGVSGLWRAGHTERPIPMVQVVVPNRDLPAGTRLGFLMVHFMDIPKALVTPDMVTSLPDMANRVTRTYMAANEPIRQSMLFHNTTNLSQNLETHERAVTLQLSDDMLLNHHLEPDDLVDVLVTLNANGKKYTKTLVQCARVLMCAPTDQILARTIQSVGNDKITLAVTPDRAEAIANATETGKIRLVLRNRLSRTESPVKGISENDLLPASAKQPETLAAKPKMLGNAGNDPIPTPPNLEQFLSKYVPPPNPVATPELAASEPPPPIEWIVEMFSGSKKEAYGVSTR